MHGPGAFLDLCDMLRKEGGPQPTQRATIEEQVAKFLYILSHGVKHREISFFFFFRHSSETINRHFHQVLRSMIQLEEKFLKQPDGSQTSVEILNSSRFFPYFKVKKKHYYTNSLIVVYIKILIYRSKCSTILVLPMSGLHWGN